MTAKPVLVAYTTNAGSTEDVAKAVAEELGKAGASVEVRRLEEVATLEPYGNVVVGGPMIVGWHRAATRFVKQHQKELGQRKVAYFFTAMSLTQTGESSVLGVPVTLDAQAAKAPKTPGRLSFRERYSSMTDYLRPVLKAAPQVKPVSAAFFGGQLQMFRLKLWQMLFVMIVIRAQPGDLRDFELIRKWAAGLRDTLTS